MKNGFNIRKQGKVVVFEVQGYLDETNAQTVFEKIYEEIGDFSENTKIIFNLDGLTYLNSKAIGYISDIITNVKEAGGQAFMSNCDHTVRDTLELVGMNNMVSFVDDSSEAMEKIGK